MRHEFASCQILATGIKWAEAEARKVGSLLALNQFDWADYEKADKSDQRKTVGYWIDKYEADFFERRGRTPEPEVNWRKDYMRALNRLERGCVDY